jgi:hypothetical protein
VRFESFGGEFRPVNLSAQDTASVRLESSGETSCYGDLDATQAPITLAPDGDNPVRVSGSVDSLSIGNVTAEVDSSIDLGYVAPAEWTLRVFPDVPPGTVVFATDAAGNRVDAAVVGEGGSAALSMPAGTHEVAIGRNVAPTTSDDEFSVSKNGVLTVEAPGILGNDEDPNGDSLTAGVLSPPDDGTVRVEANGSIRYVPDENFTGTDSFRYEASDGLRGITAGRVRITVENDPPTTTDDEYSASKNGVLTVEAPGVLENDADPNGDPLTVTAVTEASNGTIRVGANGSLRYAPDENFTGTDAFEYEVRDDDGGVSEGTVRVTVGNDPPTTSDDRYSVSKNGVLTVEAPGVLGNDADPNGDPIDAAVAREPGNGTVRIGADGSLRYVPEENFTGADTFGYVARDGDGGATEGTVRVVVRNDPPLAVASVPDEAFSGRPVTLDGRGSSDPNGDTLTYEWRQTRGPGGNLSDVGSSVASFTPPDVDEPTEVGIGLTVSDGDLGSSTVVVVTVRPGNAPPVAEAGPNRTVRAGASVTLDGGNSTAPDGEGLSYEWRQTAGPPVDLVDAGQRASFVAPDVEANETVTFRVRVDDGQATATDSVAVKILPAEENSPPTASAGSNRTVAPGTDVELDATNSTDPDGDALSYRWTQTEGPAVTLRGNDTATPTFTAPTVEGSATLSFDVTVDDGEATSTEDVTVVVVEAVVARFDGNDDGAVSTSELQAAIRAWTTGEITTEQLLAVIRVWTLDG